ncbi:HNH endonuclease signature motif containing protein [Streptomyces sp. NPDC001705]
MGKRGPQPRPWRERFWSKVERTETCWFWTGRPGSHGYGELGMGGKYGKTRTAHTLSYEIHHGPIPSGRHVLHSCDVPLCVNPEHLRLGGNAENAQDRAERGQAARKLNPEAVKVIRWVYANTPRTLADIAAAYGINTTTVHRVVTRKLWDQVP